MLPPGADSLLRRHGAIHEERPPGSDLLGRMRGGLRLDLIAATLVGELGAGRHKPLFIHLAGNHGPAAQALVRQAGYRICESLGDAVRAASQAAAGDGRGSTR